MTDFVPGNPLEEVLLAASRAGAEPAPLLDALRDSSVLIPAEQTGGPEEFEFPIIEHEGGQYVPLYTSQEQAAKGAPEQDGWLQATGADLAKMLASDPSTGIAVNPGGDLGVVLPPDTVAALRGPGEQRFPEGTEVRVGLPANEPPELGEAVAAWATGRPEIVAVHRALVQAAAEANPTLVLGLELDPDADPTAAVEACVRNLPGVAAIVLTETEQDPIAQFMRDLDQPLYRR